MCNSRLRDDLTKLEFIGGFWCSENLFLMLITVVQLTSITNVLF